jgi:hypothetical protein
MWPIVDCSRVNPNSSNSLKLHDFTTNFQLPIPFHSFLVAGHFSTHARSHWHGFNRQAKSHALNEKERQIIRKRKQGDLLLSQRDSMGDRRYEFTQRIQLQVDQTTVALEPTL